jgi:phospholipid-binding lipoprotein MlaA
MSASYHKTSANSRVRGKKIIYLTLILSALWFLYLSNPCYAEAVPPFPPARDSISSWQMDPLLRVVEADTDLDIPGLEEPVKPIADPLEPINRVFFSFNDKLYFWALKPVASGYKMIVPQPARVGVRNFFSNIATPIRLANSLLQLNFKGAGNETVRFLLNTTFGLAGFLDPAKKRFNIDKQEEDFGQTLGFYKIGPVFYINWPVFGPSSLRDTVGTVGDFFLNPWNYLVEFPVLVNVAVGVVERVNNASLTIGEYEDLKEAALDPYIALRDAYHQYRRGKIKER